MKVNDRVRCVFPCTRTGQIGTVVKFEPDVANGFNTPIRIRWDDGSENNWCYASSFRVISSKSKKEILEDRTCKIIERGGRILLRQKKGTNPWYLHSWTDIASGPDKAVWGHKETAKEIFNLHWAFTIAKLYGCKVVVLYTKKKEKKQEPHITIHLDIGFGHFASDDFQGGSQAID